MKLAFTQSNIFLLLGGEGQDEGERKDSGERILSASRFKAVPLTTLHRVSATRLPGYMQECLRRGQLDSTGAIITFTRRDWQEIRQQFNPSSGVQILSPGCCGG